MQNETPQICQPHCGKQAAPSTGHWSCALSQAHTCLGSSVFQVAAPGLKFATRSDRSGGCRRGSGPDGVDCLDSEVSASAPEALRAASCAAAKACTAAVFWPPPPAANAYTSLKMRRGMPAW